MYLGTPYIAATSGTRGENDVKDQRFKAYQSAGANVMMLIGWVGAGGEQKALPCMGDPAYTRSALFQTYMCAPFNAAAPAQNDIS